MTSAAADAAALPVWAKALIPPARYKSVRGGRGSSKTWAFAHLLVLRALAEPGVAIACIREFQSSIAESAKPAIETAIRRLGVADRYEVGRAEIRTDGGARFFFQGMERNRESIRGWEGVRYVWVEEAQRLSEATARVLVPTVRTPGSEIWFSWNPNQRTDWVYRRFVLRPRPGDVSLKVNYDRNPWFPATLDAERRHDLATDPDAYRHIWLGEPDDEGQERRVLPYALADACVRGYRVAVKRGLPVADGWGLVAEAGLDVADAGANWNVLAIRRGPTVVAVERWRGYAHLRETARRAARSANLAGVERLYFDAGGLGAGVKSDLHYLHQSEELRFAARPVLFGGEVEGGAAVYSAGVANRQFFARRNAQLGWALRLRAERTKRWLDGAAEVDPRTCLFIDPDLPGLPDYLAELSQPTWREGAGAKTEIVKRDEDEPSPDMYDATALAFAGDSRYGLRGNRALPPAAEG